VANESVCIIGGGATGAALLWCLAQDERARAETTVTLLHEGSDLGGHSLTVPVSRGGKTLDVDLGVQLISPLIYANVRLMLGLDDFAPMVPMTDYDELKLACAYPDESGAPRNWANFDAYQGDPLFSLYSPQMRANSHRFQVFLETAAFRGWAGKSVKEYFATATGYGSPQDQRDWIDYFLWPYLSIINGYGAALMDQTLVGDLIPFFMSLPGVDTPLGSFTQPGRGWQRFTNGAQSWVAAMAVIAHGLDRSSTVLLGCRVTQINTPQSGDTRPEVVWVDGDGTQHSERFDKVVSTLDMQTNASLLQQSPYWASVYKNHIDPSLWSLQPGACYIHTDPSVLSPRLRNTNGQTGFEQETLQFTAYYAPQGAYPHYDLYKTYTTYLQANLLDDPAAAGVYNTMYGYIPQPGVDTMPDPASVLYSQTWIHSKFAPSYASSAKKSLYEAQAPGMTKSYAGQPPSGVYFAGNNTTYDSEDGALEAAMIIAGYAFGVDYPFINLPHDDRHPISQALGWFLYESYYGVMFPGALSAHVSGHWYGLVAHAVKHALLNR
jgi:hypothetical protein